MKLLSLKIVKADTCGGLLDGLLIPFRDEKSAIDSFSPLCLIGPNGSGKSQLLQVMAEIFQAIFCKYLPNEESGSNNDGLEFELEYLINTKNNPKLTEHIRISTNSKGRRKNDITIEVLNNGNWDTIDDKETVGSLLPSKVIGYTSGGNETLSIPFFASRAGYAEKVRNNAFDDKKKTERIDDPRLLLIDYGTNLEVLVANLLLNPLDVRLELLQAPNLKNLHSFRCVVQLIHKSPRNVDVKLTNELSNYISYLKSCSTCYEYDEKKNSYIFDFLVNEATHKAFGHYWPNGALELYSCFHKLAMLNDLIIPREARRIFEISIKERRFASRLPEPFDEHKVFRFERVEFVSNKSGKLVDYVSLSDGEHQLAQILGTACMASFPNVLFLLDEPESHFNPQWRVEFVSKILNLPTNNGTRANRNGAAQQECLISTHSPFVASDLPSKNVFIFRKNPESSTLQVRLPRIETYGSTFDSILEECFEVVPPMSLLPRKDIETLLQSNDIDEVRSGFKRLGDSVEKLYLADRIRKLNPEGEK